MNAAEDDRSTLAAGSRQLTKLVAIAPQVRMAYHLVLLVMMPQNEKALAKLGTSRFNALGQLFIA
jgi:hypothetical protein